MSVLRSLSDAILINCIGVWLASSSDLLLSARAPQRHLRRAKEAYVVREHDSELPHLVLHINRVQAAMTEEKADTGINRDSGV